MRKEVHLQHHHGNLARPRGFGGNSLGGMPTSRSKRIPARNAGIEDAGNERPQLADIPQPRP